MIYLLTRTDKACVIRADTEEEARNLAQKELGNLTYSYRSDNSIPNNSWNDITKVICQEISVEGSLGIICSSFNAG